MTLETLSPPLKKAPLAAFIQRHPLPVFFLLVYALTWPFLIVDTLGARGDLPFRVPVPLMLVMAYMPTAAALIVTAVTGGKAAIRVLLRRLLIWRVGVQWYAFVLFGFAVFCFLAVWLYNSFSGAPALPFLAANLPQGSPLTLAGLILLTLLVVTLVNGEEIGWRGFALPRLQEKFSALNASLILGVIWAFFHLPLFFTPGSPQANVPLPLFVAGTTALAVIFTWVFNHTRGSLLIAYLLHGAVNTSTQVFPIGQGSPLTDSILYGISILIAVVLVVVLGPRNLSRGKRVTVNQE